MTLTSKPFLVRARYVQPDGVGWLTKDGHVSHCKSQAMRYASEEEAWLHLSSIDQYWYTDEHGNPDYWIEVDDGKSVAEETAEYDRRLAEWRGVLVE